VMKHKDCKFFENETCILKDCPVPANGLACQVFKPKEEVRNAS